MKGYMILQYLGHVFDKIESTENEIPIKFQINYLKTQRFDKRFCILRRFKRIVNFRYRCQSAATMFSCKLKSHKSDEPVKKTPAVLL